MEDNLFAKPAAPAEPDDVKRLQDATGNAAKAGETIWFDGDIDFKAEVRRLKEEGVLPDHEYTLPVPYLSISQVELFLKCPKQFYFRYIKGIKSAPGVAMVQGTTIHKAVEVGYQHVIDKGELPPLELALDTYASSLDTNLTEDVVWSDKELDEGSGDLIGPDQKNKGKVKDQGVLLLKEWHKKKLPQVSPLAVEKSFITTFGGIPVVGKIDLMDRVEKPLNGTPDRSKFHPLLDVVTDNKVVAKSYAQSAVDSKMQMTVYAHATGVPRQRYDLFVKTKVPKITELMTSRSSQDVRWAVQTFMDVANAISKGVFPACSPEAFQCTPKFCGYWYSCRGAP